ncbi:unnamed protein product (macronuclear) [Paramecium tetraurelia]|uniref:Uncharacterized protein n=1 Tax=Paramecium tetraurelia TaxID=5888 RepID=A0D9F8_PARTE|nr:uncharacterized protein GSPATT00014605001 [Paramecium tetraurelia]CAK79675.1 unnamed protein product [Paramecium tetraurelia]|eukprot:XP_001447072.1 hypothetical protein (macronuclear) [Paramecium tetraurelia strain d4-2]
MSQFIKATLPKKTFMVEKGFYSINLEDGTIQKLGPEKKCYKLPSYSSHTSPNAQKDLFQAKSQQNQDSTQRVFKSFDYKQNNQEMRKNQENTRKLKSQRNK